MKMCTWNVRGLNEPIKMGEVFIMHIKFQLLLCLKLEFEIKTRRKLRRSLEEVGVDQIILIIRGRIWVGWKFQEFKVVVLETTD